MHVSPLLLSVLVWSWLGEQGAPTRTLDLTGPISSLPEHRACASSSPAPSFPLKVSLGYLPAAPIEYGAEFTYDVTIQNVGSSVVTIPWSANPDDGRWSQSSAGTIRTARLSLSVASAGDTFVGATEMYGSTAVPTSLIQLAPSETVLVHARGSWVFDLKQAMIVIGRAPSAIQVRAELRISTTECVRSRPLLSDPATIYLRRQP